MNYFNTHYLKNFTSITVSIFGLVIRTCRRDRSLQCLAILLLILEILKTIIFWGHCICLIPIWVCPTYYTNGQTNWKIISVALCIGLILKDIYDVLIYAIVSCLVSCATRWYSVYHLYNIYCQSHFQLSNILCMPPV